MAKENNNKTLVKELAALINGGHAHAGFEHAVKDLPQALRGKSVENVPYTIWQLVEHIRISLRDMLEFSKGTDYKELDWPDDYWPDEKAPADDKAWEKSLQQIQDDSKAFNNLLEDPDRDIYEAFSWGSGQTLLKEALQIADHASYHTGEIIVLRRLLGAWK